MHIVMEIIGVIIIICIMAVVIFGIMGYLIFRYIMPWFNWLVDKSFDWEDEWNVKREMKDQKKKGSKK